MNISKYIKEKNKFIVAKDSFKHNEINLNVFAYYRQSFIKSYKEFREFNISTTDKKHKINNDKLYIANSILINEINKLYNNYSDNLVYDNLLEELIKERSEILSKNYDDWLKENLIISDRFQKQDFIYNKEYCEIIQTGEVIDSGLYFNNEIH